MWEWPWQPSTFFSRWRRRSMFGATLRVKRRCPDVSATFPRNAESARSLVRPERSAPVAGEAPDILNALRGCCAARRGGKSGLIWVRNVFSHGFKTFADCDAQTDRQTDQTDTDRCFGTLPCVLPYLTLPLHRCVYARYARRRRRMCVMILSESARVGLSHLSTLVCLTGRRERVFICVSL